MAAPSSSATSPSPTTGPPLHFASATSSAESSLAERSDDDDRKQAVQRFLARAEVSTLTRALRTRLSYASYKAAHKVAHMPLDDLEAQNVAETQNTTASTTRTMSRRRTGTGQQGYLAKDYYNNPATQSVPSSTLSSLRRVNSTGPTPAYTLSPRTYYPNVNGQHSGPAPSGGTPDASKSGPHQSLYTSILAPPPSAQARTILNPHDPPLTASPRSVSSPRAGRSKPASRSNAESVRAQARSRRDDLGAPESKRRRLLGSSKGKDRQTYMDIDSHGDIDMTAAAALTSLMMQRRPSVGVDSPRSTVSVVASESGSNHIDSGERRLQGSSSRRDVTPPPGSPLRSHASTPRPPAPTDSEAANLMLFLATSPSPVKTNDKTARDRAAYGLLRNNSSGTLQSPGRVLFSDVASGNLSEGRSYKGHGPSLLSRGGERSFNSSLSSIDSQMGVRPSTEERPTGSPRLLPPPALPDPAPVASVSNPRFPSNPAASPGLVSEIDIRSSLPVSRDSPRPTKGVTSPPSGGAAPSTGNVAPDSTDVMSATQPSINVTSPQDEIPRIVEPITDAGADLQMLERRRLAAEKKRYMILEEKRLATGRRGLATKEKARIMKEEEQKRRAVGETPPAEVAYASPSSQRETTPSMETRNVLRS
ncbi:hypothetical protein FISHEDRAFT_62137 [Fistulina hepatica ATCC 64428]|nr:hypothetical protein FISHEDRAFT_62137 [Fistulina hepatica ATCC 64428]